jgi:tetratricopeptide (TPR) repeat protein
MRTGRGDSSSRATALIEPIQIVGTGNYQAAIQALKQALKDDFSNAEAHAWLAYCLKRTGELTSAIEEIKTALEQDKREIFSWLYNLACYECLAGASVEQVVTVLNRALKAANGKQKADLKADLMGDDDFAKIKDHPAFLNFLDKL